MRSTDPTRRSLLRGGAALIGSGAFPGRLSLAAKTPLAPLPEGIKVGYQINANLADEDLAFARQLGCDHVCMWSDAQTATYDVYAARKAKVEAAGLKIWNINNASVHNMEEVTLGLPGRDEKIEEYKRYLRLLGRVGIKYTTYAHMGNGIWSSEKEETRGGARARALDMAKNPHGWWMKKRFDLPLSHGRRYGKEEIWENFRYFIKQVVPVAEEVGVRIGIHPDDPPVPELAGVPRCIFGNFDGYVKALEIANSPNIGVCLCCGSWLEGGKDTGKEVTEAIEYFGKRGKLWKIHFRNVSGPMPRFVETFPDDGYYDMYKIMRALKKVDFRGVIIPDHVPALSGDKDGRAGAAYCFGYIRALMQRAAAELGP